MLIVPSRFVSRSFGLVAVGGGVFSTEHVVACHLGGLESYFENIVCFCVFGCSCFLLGERGLGSE